MLDKFIGDAIMAGFGVPVPHEDDGDRARARRDRHDRGAARAGTRSAPPKGRQPIDIGIGLNTDIVVSGNIGSQKRMDFTMIGDGVNLASRLESACKQYGAHILISEFTYRQLRGTYRTREVDLVVVKGKTEPVAIYEILDYHTDETYPLVSDALGRFRDGLAKYRRRDFVPARALFQEVLAINPDDKTAQMYVERCDLLAEQPPAPDWVGVWVMDHK